MFPRLQALWEEPVHAGRQGLHSGAKLNLFPLPLCGVQHVRPSGPLPGFGGPRVGRHAAVRPGGRPWAGPLQRAALRPTDGHPPPGDANKGSCHFGGWGGDERAGAQRPAGPLPHQGHAVCFSVRVLSGAWMGGGGGGWQTTECVRPPCRWLTGLCWTLYLGPGSLSKPNRFFSFLFDWYFGSLLKWKARAVKGPMVVPVRRTGPEPVYTKGDEVQAANSHTQIRLVGKRKQGHCWQS